MKEGFIMYILILAGVNMTSILLLVLSHRRMARMIRHIPELTDRECKEFTRLFY